jgi:hypothetical protein
VDSGYLIRRHTNIGNLHISICGEFNGMCAWELFKLVKRHKAGTGRVFVNTVSISRILPDGVALFKFHLPRRRIPPDWLYFKGEKGFQIAPDGSRVLIQKRCGNRRGLNSKNTDQPTITSTGVTIGRNPNDIKRRNQ